MESLETELRRIEDLRRDLSATLIVKEGYSHKENVEVSEQVCDGWSVGVRTEYRTEQREVNVPPEHKPDEQTRETARAELQQAYDSSEWYSAKFVAGKCLDISVDKQLNSWLTDLRHKMDLPISESVATERVKGYTTDGYNDKRWDVPVYETVWGEEPLENNRDSIRKSIQDVATLFQFTTRDDARDLLKRTYHHNPLSDVRKNAGRAIGYSSVRIWTHEHPVAATLIGIAAVGAASGLGYALVEYFSK